MEMSDATMVYYRGYLIESRVCEDWVPDPRAEWAIFRTAPSGKLEEVSVVNTEEAAIKLIDKLAAD